MGNRTAKASRGDSDKDVLLVDVSEHSDVSPFEAELQTLVSRTYGLLFWLGWTVFAVCYVLLGALVFHFTQDDWGFTTATYTAIVTLFTIGYGDFAPVDAGTRMFTVFYVLVGLLFTAYTMSVLGEMVLARNEGIIRSLLQAEDGFLPRRPSVWPKLLRCVVFVSLSVLVGAVWWSAVNHANFGEGFYWAVTTVTTVGIGDLVPTNAAGRIFVMVYCMIGVPVFALGLASFSDIFIEREQYAAAERLFEHHRRRTASVGNGGVSSSPDLSVGSARSRSTAGGGGSLLDRLDFTEATLIKLGKVTREELDHFRQQFHDLAPDHNFTVDRAALGLDRSATARGLHAADAAAQLE